MTLAHRISVFDLDHTLVKGNSSFGFCTFLHKQKVFSTSSLLKAYWYRLRHEFSSVPLKQWHTELFHCLLKGLSLDLLESFAEFFVQSAVLSDLYFPAFQELRFAQHRGEYTIIMSSSPEFLVRHVAQALDVDECIATQYHLDASKHLLDVQHFIDGQAKAEALHEFAQKKNIPLQLITAYSDSYRDLPLLQIAGQPVAVNPDPKLLAISLEKQWRLM